MHESIVGDFAQSLTIGHYLLKLPDIVLDIVKVEVDSDDSFKLYIVKIILFYDNGYYGLNKFSLG